MSFDIAPEIKRVDRKGLRTVIASTGDAEIVIEVVSHRMTATAQSVDAICQLAELYILAAREAKAYLTEFLSNDEPAGGPSINERELPTQLGGQETGADGDATGGLQPTAVGNVPAAATAVDR